MRKKHWMKVPFCAALTEVSERLRPKIMDKQTCFHQTIKYLHSDFLSGRRDTVTTALNKKYCFGFVKPVPPLLLSMSSLRFFNPFLHISGEKEILAAACLHTRKASRLILFWLFRVDGQSASKWILPHLSCLTNHWHHFLHPLPPEFIARKSCKSSWTSVLALTTSGSPGS